MPNKITRPKGPKGKNVTGKKLKKTNTPKGHKSGVDKDKTISDLVGTRGIKILSSSSSTPNKIISSSSGKPLFPDPPGNTSISTPVPGGGKTNSTLKPFVVPDTPLSSARSTRSHRRRGRSVDAPRVGFPQPPSSSITLEPKPLDDESLHRLGDLLAGKASGEVRYLPKRKPEPLTPRERQGIKLRNKKRRKVKVVQRKKAKKGHCPICLR